MELLSNAASYNLKYKCVGYIKECQPVYAIITNNGIKISTTYN